MHAQRMALPGGRWHFQHGPIDIVIGADGHAAALAAAHEAAWLRFGSVLPELVGELRTLRQPVRGPCALAGPVARRMWDACRPFHDRFITPMAAVAGAVAEELIAFYRRAGVERAWVNNGGDIALHLGVDRSLRVGLFAGLERLDATMLSSGIAIDGDFEVTHAMPVRGVATSGWRGRSFSLGIADAVTVLARTAAAADAAATMIANEVDVDDARIVRRPACELRDDTDLGELAVTVEVPALSHDVVGAALARGLAHARRLQRRGLIEACVLVCQGQAAASDFPRVRAEAPAT